MNHGNRIWICAGKRSNYRHRCLIFFNIFPCIYLFSKKLYYVRSLTNICYLSKPTKQLVVERCVYYVLCDFLPFVLLFVNVSGLDDRELTI